MPHVDLAFRLNGSVIPVDHGYALYAGLSRVLPEIHQATDIGVQPIRGLYSGNGKLQLSDSSRLILRLPDTAIRSCLKLAGKRLRVAECPLSVGVPEVRMLPPVAGLRARLVTIRGFLLEADFLAAAMRQLQGLNITSETRLGQRRTFRIKDKQVVGFELAVAGLAADDSVKLQEHGLGGRRKMGCGMFVPGEGERACNSNQQ